MEKEIAIQRKVKSAMMYPSFVLLIAAVAVFALLYFVIPAMDVLFSQIGGHLPTITVIVLAVANFLQANILFILLGLFVVIAFLWWYRRTDTGKKSFGSLVLKIPLIGKVILISSMTQISRNIAVMVRGGITITECLDLMVETTENVALRRALDKVRTAVHSGDSLSSAVTKQPVFPALFGQVIGVGETSGRLEANLEVLADFYETEADRAVGRATGLLSPILVVCCGLMVGLIALAIYTPIYSLMGQLSSK
jgi:type IV pilus assembly protein PilC